MSPCGYYEQVPFCNGRCETKLQGLTNPHTTAQRRKCGESPTYTIAQGRLPVAGARPQPIALLFAVAGRGRYSVVAVLAVVAGTKQQHLCTPQVQYWRLSCNCGTCCLAD
eukprot:359572-Chlamydomonas_euryale.AAC.3